MSSSNFYTVDLRSDTVCKPTESMREAMAKAVVGDDVFGEDPTVNALQSKISKMLRKEAALLVPSGTMANLIAVMVHCNKRGAELICGKKSHIYTCEQGGASQIANVFVQSIENLPDGTFDLEEFEEMIRGSDYHAPVTTMVAIENTHNYCGGKVLPLKWIDDLATIANQHNLVVHMDGARLFNASEYMREDPARLVRDCHSVSVCFSKGMGAPVGSALVGSQEFIEQARRVRKVLGGGMRKAGVFAAAAIVAIDESIPSFYADHRRAKYLAESLSRLNLKSFYVDAANTQTNMVVVEISKKSSLNSTDVCTRLSQMSANEVKAGIRTYTGGCIAVLGVEMSKRSVRLTLHHDINDEDTKLAIIKVSHVLKELDGR